MKHFWLIAPLFSLLAVPLFAQTPEFPSTSGNAFLRLCSVIELDEPPQNEMAHLYGCIGYVEGFTSGVGFEKVYAADRVQGRVPAPFCIPAKAENGQIIRIVLKYIRDNPEHAHVPTAVLIVTALGSVYPCPTK